MDTINTNIDTNSVDKKKKHFIPKLIAILTSAFSIIGVGTSLLIKSQYKSALAVEYIDDTYSIVFNTNELNNYTWNNFNNFGIEYYTENEEYITNYFTHVYLGLNTLAFNDGGIDEDYFYFSYTYNDIELNFNFDINNNMFRFLNDSSPTSFVDSVQIVFPDSSFYESMKDVIELDIQANQTYTNNTFLQDIVELLVGGIVAFSGGFATGLNSLVSALAIQNGAMSPFISIVLIFGGLALAFGLSRWVVNLISSLGQRNR